ncbi:MAG: cyclic nucleotide-binding protein [Candidatus Lambdaproteobacteria bacterium]|nr:cyclic nucleotide-binding domain-containing protein [Candidatus Lambdaproteobacteria bacterium]
MNDWDIYLILLNCGYTIYLAAFLAKKIVWLRLLTITGNFLVVPYFLYFRETPLWNSIFWISIYTIINLVMLFIIYIESRDVKLSDLEQKIYDLTFKSLERRVFKKLIDHGSLEELQPEVDFITRDTELESLMYVVEGEVEVVLKHGEQIIIPTGGFIGEQSYITGERTSADVKTGKEAAKIIRWNSQVLRKYLAGKEVLKDNLDLIFTADLIHKLRDMEEDIDQIRHSQDLKIKNK